MTCSAQNGAAAAVAEVPKDMQTPQEVASVFQRLQNGSDIRGIAIAGLSLPIQIMPVQSKHLPDSNSNCVVPADRC